jgi:hypothetical protein
METNASADFGFGGNQRGSSDAEREARSLGLEEVLSTAGGQEAGSSGDLLRN